MMNVKRGRPTRAKQNPPTRLGKLLTSYRNQNKVGLKYIAEFLGCSVAFVSNIEQGRAPLPVRMIPDMAALMNVSVRKLTLAVISSWKDGRTVVGYLTKKPAQV